MARVGRILGWTRYLMLVGVVASVVLAALLFIVMAGRTVAAVEEAAAALTSEKAVKLLTVACIELADLTLIAAALYIIGVGLFELFIAPVPMPSWLTITSLDDLKSALINIVVVALGVTFLGQIVTWDGHTNLLTFGVAIGAVIVALAAFGALRLTPEQSPQTGEDGDTSSLRTRGLPLARPRQRQPVDPHGT